MTANRIVKTTTSPSPKSTLRDRMVPPMTRETATLAIAMQRMSRALEESAMRLALGELGPDQQDELTDLLAELWELLVQHAGQTTGLVVESPDVGVSANEQPLSRQGRRYEDSEIKLVVL